MDNINDNSKYVNYVYDTEDSNDASVSQYQFARREVVIKAVPKRSDSWAEHESSVLLKSWGERLLKGNRNFVKSEEWDEVAEKVSEVSDFKRTTINCRNRLDTLKKIYKKEKAKLGEKVGLSSDWVHFSKMDMILCPYLYQANEYPLENPEVHLICANPSEEREDIEKSTGHPTRANSADEMNNGLIGGSEFANAYPLENSEVHLICAILPEEIESVEKSTGQPTGANSADEMNNGFVGSEFADDERDNLDYVPPRKIRVRKEKRAEKNETIESGTLADLEKTRIELIRDLKLERKKILKRGMIEIAKIWGVSVDEDDTSPGNTSG